MSDHKPDWTKDELSAYLLLYCANANFVESEEEIKLIRSKVSPAKYRSIHEAFEQDNDYQSARKIQLAVQQLGLSPKEIDGLIQEMRQLFFADGDFEQAEKAVFLGIKHLLKAE
jgi:hypothetical protein